MHDPNLKLDVAFNYGTFDFNTPGFYLKFLRGKLLYFVNAERFDQMYHVYMRMNRSLKEQQLNLTLKERQEVFKFLIINYKPENRYYLYDFFFDNCSSRIRDVFKNILGSRLEFEEYTNDNRSFRQLADECVAMVPWEHFGMDLVFGLPADQKVNSWNRMFLPEQMMLSFKHAIIKNDSVDVPFASPITTIYQEIPVREEKGFITPLQLFWTLWGLVLILTIFQLRQQKQYEWIDLILFTLSGILGLAILFMWFGTDHPVTKNNMNLFWALPFNIFVPFILIINKESNYLKWYLVFNVILNIAILICWKFIPQEFNIAVIPIILIFLTRSITLLLLNYKRNISIKPNFENHVD